MVIKKKLTSMLVRTLNAICSLSRNTVGGLVLNVSSVNTLHDSSMKLENKSSSFHMAIHFREIYNSSEASSENKE